MQLQTLLLALAMMGGAAAKLARLEAMAGIESREQGTNLEKTYDCGTAPGAGVCKSATNSTLPLASAYYNNRTSGKFLVSAGGH